MSRQFKTGTEAAEAMEHESNESGFKHKHKNADDRVQTAVADNIKEHNKSIHEDTRHKETQNRRKEGSVLTRVDEERLKQAKIAKEIANVQKGE